MDNIFGNFYMNGGIERAKAQRKEQEENGEILRTNISNYTIDSCFTFDEGFETAIWKDKNPMIIVERYNTRNEMIDGHKKWCEFCKNNPTEVFSVQMGGTIKF